MVPEAHGSKKDSGFHLEFLAVFEDLYVGQIEPFTASMPEGEAEPVR
jgi:hypothetical protein